MKRICKSNPEWWIEGVIFARLCKGEADVVQKETIGLLDNKLIQELIQDFGFIEEGKEEEAQEVKLLGTDTEEGITCEIRGYWKDGICYVKDVINRRTEDLPPTPDHA